MKDSMERTKEGKGPAATLVMPSTPYTCHRTCDLVVCVVGASTMHRVDPSPCLKVSSIAG